MWKERPIAQVKHQDPPPPQQEKDTPCLDNGLDLGGAGFGPTESALAQQSRGIVQECRVTAQQCTATLIAAHDALARSRELEVAVQDFMAQLRNVGPR